jgi:Ion transport protein
VTVNPWFDRVILTVIILNCVYLGLDNEIEIVSMYSDNIDFVFLIIYTIEMVLKIIAMGFFMLPHSYLRDAWNILDFSVVILGWISNFLSNSNVSAIRVIRILRPLRTINSMPGMSGLVLTILNSLPIMFDILVLFIFMLIMFGTIAT